ncbi:MAG: hypothetical protein KF768_10900 [Phycisphaeraceae bacterium]|nr:hypothetical protein [Phycisphaeraceae bacterium]
MNMRSKGALRGVAALVVCVAGLAAGASASGVKVLYVNSNVQPGDPRGSFNTPWGTVNFLDFERPFASPSGRFWAIRGRTVGTSSPDFILVHDMQTGTARVVALEAASGFVNGLAGEVIESISIRLAINDSGNVLYSTNTTAATTVDQVVALYRWATDDSVVLVREGEFIPGSSLVASGLAADIVGLGNDDTAYFIIDTGTTTNALDDEFFLALSADLMTLTVLAEELVTIPTGQESQAQSGGGDSDQIPLSEFDATNTVGAAGVSADGSTFYYHGDLQLAATGYVGPVSTTARDKILCRDNAVLIQEGVVFDAMTGTGGSSSFQYTHMTHDGRILARSIGPNLASPDWVVRQTAGMGFDLLVRTGDEIFPGANEFHSDVEFSATFFLFQGDGQGNFVIGSVTDGPTESNGVLIYNNECVLARENDPIDFDDNGMFDDDRRFNTFGNDDLAFVQGNKVIITFTMRTDAGAVIGAAGSFVGVMDLPACGASCPGDYNGDNVVDLADLLDFLGAWNPNLGQSVTPGTNGDINGDGVVDLADLLDFLGEWNPNLGQSCV